MRPGRGGGSARIGTVVKLHAMHILLSERQIADGVSDLAGRIDRHYGRQPITVVAVMTGSLVLFADLIRRLSMPVRVGVVHASSYRGGTAAGRLEIDPSMLIDVTGRDVLLVDDIFDTGATLTRLVAAIERLGASSVTTAVLLRKDIRRAVDLQPDFVAFEIPDEFVVGYGLDYNDLYRNLPHVAVLDPAQVAAVDGPAASDLND